jgi:uncharacterized protein (UPF0210 family)
MPLPQSPAFRVRTITAFTDASGPDDERIARALRFLRDARARATAAGLEVQTVRLALRLEGARPDAGWRARCAAIDARVAESGAMWTPGPEIAASDLDAFPAWVSAVVGATRVMFASAEIAPAARGVDRAAVRTAAATIARLAAETEDGHGNFRFAAAARCPAGIPFFPVARHEGEPAFAIGLESAAIVGHVYAARPEDPTAALRAALSTALAPVAALACDLSREAGVRFLGIDTSAAPGLDASIGGAIEHLSGVPFGCAGTLAACAATTAALQSVDVQRHGYCGLMLPVLEDRILAARTDEGRFAVRDLLQYSAVCGIGLDVVPLAGNTSLDALTRLLTDVAALATRLSKPLSARLLPVPGTQAGDRSRFENEWMVNSRVLAIE